MPRKKFTVRFWIALPLVVILGLYFLPKIFSHENATVFLDGCLKPECELRGDLSLDLFTGDYILVQGDGTRIQFAEERITFIDLPD